MSVRIGRQTEIGEVETRDMGAVLSFYRYRRTAEAYVGVRCFAESGKRPPI